MAKRVYNGSAALRALASTGRNVSPLDVKATKNVALRGGSFYAAVQAGRAIRAKRIARGRDPNTGARTPRFAKVQGQAKTLRRGLRAGMDSEPSSRGSNRSVPGGASERAASSGGHARRGGQSGRSASTFGGTTGRTAASSSRFRSALGAAHSARPSSSTRRGPSASVTAQRARNKATPAYGKLYGSKPKPLFGAISSALKSRVASMYGYAASHRPPAAAPRAASPVTRSIIEKARRRVISG